MLNAAGVKCVQLRTDIKDLALTFVPEEERK
jgi:hypothetical protein